MGARIVVEAAAVDRLAELGLSVQILERVVRRADAEVSTCTPLDPPMMAGLIRWARTARYLREELVPAGWHFDNPQNLPRTIHPSGDFAIVAITGDELTGGLDVLPTTKHPRGPATALAVATNEQLPFDFDGFDFGLAPGRTLDAGHLLTWILLFHVHDEAFQVELSLPDAIEDGRITGWAERIIVPPFPREPVALPDVSADLSMGEIVVEVNRR
ncbi:hypothetical protein GCM10009765_04720 [Fodinicola feengrottensis]|uniref:Uncharacterized protein n=1 Tax=Fodinicola feengrottensis TaxID=435914 RepID=A0ABP4RR24_9ACTN